MSEPVLRRAHPVLRAPFNVWDLVAAALILGVFLTISHGAKETFAPLTTLAKTPISLDPWRLPEYALRTSLRMIGGLAASLAFTLSYATLAAKSKHAEIVLIPLLDILQSIPVFGYLTFTLAWFLALAPGNVAGAEFASVFLAFTAQAWNMAFSFYQSLRTVPEEMTEAGRMFGLNGWARFWRIEVPFGLPPLIWNMMMSMSGGWFFVVAAEAISVGPTTIVLPGIGSYIASAIKQQNLGAIAWAIGAMLVVILIYDQLLFRPLVAWADKFRIDTEDSEEYPESWALNVIRRSDLMDRIAAPFHAFMAWTYRLTPAARGRAGILRDAVPSRAGDAVWWVFLTALAIFALWHIWLMLGSALSFSDVASAAGLGAITLVRVIVLIALASLIWTPIGVYVGLRPHLAHIIQPVAQFLAAFPANLVFPVAVYLIVRYALNPDIALSPLMVLGTQWYILFNVIAGASAIPRELRDAGTNLQVKGLLWWRKIALPGVFPYYVTGAITASGGSWNAAIVAEVATWGSHTLRAHGLGAYIADATQAGNFHRIVLGIATMSFYVVVVNRLFWRPLYWFAERRYRLT